MKCNGDCFNCIFSDCIASDAEIMAMEHNETVAERERKTRQNEYYYRWCDAHREEYLKYHREYMQNWRAKKKEAAV